MSPSRDLDLVVLGATGFTGRQAAAYLAAHAPAGLRWVLAARNLVKLHGVRDSLGPDHAQRECVVVDTLDAAAVDRLAARTRVLLTTVGPYAELGSEVLAACARHGTDYVDITGETPWVADMIARHHETARDTGARIVPCCGFDSVPSDLGTWMMVDWIRREWGQETRRVEAVFKARGGFNGATVASALGMLERGEEQRFLQPFLLDPAGTERPPAVVERSADQRGPLHLDCVGGWTAPFFMAPVNSRVVRRSQALLAGSDQAYGEGFAYREAMWAGRGLRGQLVARQVSWALRLLFGLGRMSWVRSLLSHLVPEPGEGPSEAVMDRGFFQVQLQAEAADGSTVRGLVQADGDPGNRNTVRMLCEAALCLCEDSAELAPQGGVLTPASALGRPYLERLRAAGTRWEVGG